MLLLQFAEVKRLAAHSRDLYRCLLKSSVVVDPIFWLGLSILLVAVSLTAVLITLLPAVKELARAARSAEKLFDTLNRELPPTLEAIRLTSLEITDLTDDVTDGVKSAGRVVQQVDQSIGGLKKQAKKAQNTTSSLVVGFKAAWNAFKRPAKPQRRPDRLPPADRPSVDFGDPYRDRQTSNNLSSNSLNSSPSGLANQHPASLPSTEEPLLLQPLAEEEPPSETSSEQGAIELSNPDKFHIFEPSPDRNPSPQRKPPAVYSDYSDYEDE